MAEPSRDRAEAVRPAARSPFSRGRLAVGLVGVLIVAGAVAFGLRQFRSGPDLGRLLYATQRGVFARDLDSGARGRVASLPGNIIDVWPDDEGRRLGYLQRDRGLWLLDLESGARWQVADRQTVGRGWAPDGRFIAAEVSADRDVVAIDPGDRGTDLLFERFRGGELHWLDEERVVTIFGSDLVLIDVTGPEAKKLADDRFPLAASPDGLELLITATKGEPKLVIATLEGDKIAGRREVFDGRAYTAAVSRQGFVAFSGRDGRNQDGTWVLESRTKPPRRVARGQADQLAWSSDGSSLILLVDGKVTAVDLRDDRTIRLSPAGTRVISIAVVP